MGPTVSCGHYTAVAQAPTGNFYQFDDSMVIKENTISGNSSNFLFLLQVRPISHQAVFSTNAYIMLYELESAPFAQKPSTITSNKLKALSGNNNNGNSTQINKEQTFVNATKANGITSDKVYGPELPACMNGLNGKNDSSSSSESDSETVNVKNGSCSERLLPAPSMPAISKMSEKPPVHEEFKSKLPPVLKPQNRVTLPSPSAPSFRTNKDSVATAPVTKLVPYEMDDSSNCSDESSCSRAETETRITTKATIGEWKVTPYTPTNPSNQELPSSEGKSWQRKKSEVDNRSTVNELMRMSHNGYGAPVSSWNGTRAQLDKEINNERREERKRALSDNSDQGRAKHPKLNSHGSYKSNPGYNPVQVIHTCLRPGSKRICTLTVNTF